MLSNIIFLVKLFLTVHTGKNQQAISSGEQRMDRSAKPSRLMAFSKKT
jgi:hypothetical protein